MKRLSRLALIFAILFAILIISPALFDSQFGPYPLMKLGDVIDIATPLILIPIYWLLFQLKPEELPQQGQMLLFMAFTAAWAAGQGMHLAANSIGHLLVNMVDTDVYKLAYFYDEDLSHYIWHAGVVGLSALILYRQWRNAFASGPEGLAGVTVGGLIYGFTYFLTIVEAGTALLGVPFAVAVATLGLVWGRKQFKHQPMTAFFVIAYVLATLLFIIWAIRWGGLPQFSEVGIIQ